MEPALLLIIAYFLDRLLGDPSWFPHPVVAMGWMIRQVEKALRWCEQVWRLQGKWALRLLGCLFPILVVGGVYILSFLLVQGVAAVSVSLAWGLEALLIATTIATKGLADAAQGILSCLRQGDLAGARQQLAMVVGRDTETLDESEVVRGTVETVAENIVDAVTAPLFFAAIGGAPLALAYRAVNTLDSMVGYQNQRYRHLGWASARLDDGANWLPARLTVGPMLGALMWKGYDAKGAWQILRRDARKHPSPNSGMTEAAMAGGLGIQLGGTNRYQGVVSHRALLGDPVEERTQAHILASITVLKVTTLLFTIGLALVVWVV